MRHKTTTSSSFGEEEGDDDCYSFGQSLWFFSLISIQIGVERQPSSIPGKLLMFAWSAFTVIALTTYTANLMAFFASSTSDKPLSSIEDIFNSGRNISTFKSYEFPIRRFKNPLLKTMNAVSCIYVFT